MKSLIIITLISTILAERPDWYPENPAAIEEKCMQDHSITPEIWSTIRSFKMEDSPNIRAFLLCLNINKGVFRPDKGFEPERLATGIRLTANVDCDVNMIRSCGEKYADLQPNDYMIYSIIKCTVDHKDGNCHKIQ
ncbi:uncharacterized protein LOC142219717 [Haematobia irritans]|uniref:uncharacterized protein LOC142219717 n=1 Tax=Haematobia irritans TaxID=7368 RepID=UPI003F5042CF